MPARLIAARPPADRALAGRFLLAMLVLTTCCAAKKYYPIIEHPRLRIAALQSVPGRPSAEVVFEFYSRGKPSAVISRKWQPFLTQLLRDTGRFNEAAAPDFRFTVRMDNAVDSVAGPIAQGAVSGLTLGLIGTKTTDNYVIKADFTPVGGATITKEYRYAIITTSGSIKENVEDVVPYETLDGAFRKVIEQCLLRFLVDLQNEGAMGR